jgi:NAD(P)-dependent dehydrogenase (short-subunit alcohol dehydrogenase family)
MTTKRNILISGSSRGIGREVSNLLKCNDLNIITMGNSTKSEADFYADLRDPDESDRVAKEIYSKVGTISVVICNAGTGKKPTEINDVPQLKEYFYRTNFDSAKNLIESCIPFLDSKNSSVIGISSIVALKEIANAPIGYADSKVALNELFKSKALEMANKGIRFNLITLGNVFFPGSRWEEIEKENPILVNDMLIKNVPLKSFISPNEIADAILFLSSTSARNITGANLVIDGGQSL